MQPPAVSLRLADWLISIVANLIVGPKTLVIDSFSASYFPDEPACGVCADNFSERLG
jgi:hypothetical protein